MVTQSVQTNVPALAIIDQIRRTDSRLDTNLERLSTGLRINRASDDPGGFVTSNRLESQFRGLDRAAQNTQEAVNLTEVALGGLQSIIDQLQEIRNDALAAANTGAIEASERQAFQSSIEERLGEIEDIANNTRFGSKTLLNGAFDSNVRFRTGTRDFGGNIAFGPNASTLLTGTSFLNIAKTQDGSERIRSAGDGSFNTGVQLSTDLSVNIGQFIDNGGAAAALGDTLANATFNTVSLQDGGSFQFSGVLANGTTQFTGSISLDTTTSLADLVSAIQSSIDAAETTIGIDTVGGTGALETNAGLDANGRLNFSSGAVGTPSQFDLTLTAKDTTGATQTRVGTTRAETINNAQLGLDATGALLGNSVTAITGSTFPTGTFDIEISNVLTAEQRTITADSGFFNNVSLTNPSAGGDDIRDAFLGGIDIDAGDIIEFTGSDPDGTTFSTSLTVQGGGPPVDPGDGEVRTFDDLIAELNYRDRTGASSGFNGATATFVSGEIQVVDDIAQASSTDFTFTLSDVSAPGTAETVDPSVDAEGRSTTATLRIGDGDPIQVSAGEVVTIQGDPNLAQSGQSAPQVTLRVGRNLTEGSDQLAIVAETFAGRLNGGTSVAFFSGESSVTFTSGEASIAPTSPPQSVTLDFDAIVDVTATPEDGGETFQIEASSRSLDFFTGASSDQEQSALIPDVRPNNLGLSAEQNLSSVDVTTLSGANEAITIIDAALEQVNQASAQLGAFSNRLQSSFDRLNLESDNIETAYNTITSVDVAEETTDLANNAVLLEAQSAVLIQANNSADQVFRILYGLDS